MINSDFGKRRVVIYARVSTEHEAQISALENQVDWYKPILAARPEWELVGQYIDEGITGTSAEKRPQFMKMIRDAKQKKFDMIITREVSRFARNTVDTLQYTRELKAKGVEVFFINDNIKTFDGDGELRLTIMATLAQDESRKTSIRVKSGQQTSMENGVFYGNGNILGYKRVQKLLPDNKKQVDFFIDPVQAETVKLIYEMYLAGNGLTKIKEELERRGHKTAMGKTRWYETVIGHVLKNSFYCGIITYHKEYTPDYLTQKKIKNYGEIELVQVKGRHEPIISEEDYERVQMIMASKTAKLKNLNTGRRSTTGKRPRTTVWGKLLICECGHRFNTRFWGRDDRQTIYGYQCYDSVRTGSYESRKKKGLPLDGICRTPMIPDWKLQMMANYIFRNYLSEKDKVLALANSMLEAHINDKEDDVDYEAIIERKQRELEKFNNKLSNYIDMRAEGEIDKEQFTAKTSEIKADISRLNTEIEELEAKLNKEPAIVDYKDKLTVLQYALEQYTNADDDDIPESVIEAFVVKIVAKKDGFDWYLRFDGDPNDPLHLKTEGKRRKNSSVLTVGDNSPTKQNCDTGSYQGRLILKELLK
ncbi:MAG: recombinase family protein [Clostridia bacterium]|nr:recombinase family protein [Clostridia bacterium]